MHISTALLLFGTGFLQVMFLRASLQAQPGQSVTMLCTHAIHVSGQLCWFKQTDVDVPITILCMLYTESLQKVEPKYFNTFTKDQMAMNLFNKNSTLTIKNASTSDSGFYFCGATEYHITFGIGTRLEVKESKVKGTSTTDDEKSAVSTEECSRGIFFTLTLVFGAILVFTCIIPLLLAIIREHKRQKHKVTECQTQQHDDKDSHSTLYAALQFSKQKTRRAARHAEDTDVVYSATR